ncbi:MAG TPA: RHS repeat-associated core domain-containing protein [Terriglobales bacterium]|jgi:RHS repeat-associated protein|nr:RHS repeat-associated core domain-containing protein [Terriglobales bacterium]
MRIKVLAFAVSIFALLVVIPPQCVAQTGPLAAPGILPFSTNEWGIDLATGAVRIDIPLRSKTGKIPYSSHLTMTNYYGLNYPSNTWYVSKDFSLQDTTTVFLSRKNDPRMPCKIGTVQKGWEWLVHATAVVDQTGASHPFSPRSNPTYWRNDGGAYCPAQTSALAVTNDGGYTLSVPVNGVPVVYDRSGTGSTINASVATSMTDPDGSAISWTASGSLTLLSATDTLNTPLLNIDSYGGYGGLTPASFSYTDASGNKQSYTVGFTTLSLLSAFGCGIPEFASSYPMVTSLSTPAGGSYTFAYEPTPGHSGNYTGRIAKITLPSGGSIAYSYSDSSGHNGIDCVYLNVPEITVTVNDNNGNSGTYTYVTSAPTFVQAYRQFTVTKTDPANNQTVYTFYGEYQTQVQTYQGQASGTPLKAVLTCYNGNFTNCAAPSTFPLLPITQTDVYTSLGTSPFSLVETKLDIYGNQTELKQYDFGATIPPSGNPVSDTLLSYGQSWNGTSCASYPSGTYILDTPCYSHTMNSSGQDVAKTQITYSNTGHPTSTSRWTGATWTTSTATYNSNGTLATAKDPNGNTTSHSYNGSGGCNGILPTSITSPTVNGVTASTSQSWDCNGGVTTSSTDANLKQTTYAYNDPLYRQTQVHFPDGGGTTTTYNTGLTLPWNISTSTAIASGLNLTATSIYDGLARLSQTELSSDPDGPTFTATTYDGLGRVYRQYNPTRCTTPTSNCGEATWGYTTTNYDALGRVTSTTAQDGSPTISVYSGNCVTSSDPAGKSRKSCSDSLGRLTDVWEDPAGFNYHTVYAYDALGNLLTVVQNGSHQRSFTYDSLSRLVCASNPENSTASCPTTASGSYTPGTTGYTYDANGNLSSKTSLAPNQTGTATVTRSYCYDALNRLTSKAYTLQSCPMGSPIATYFYDQASYNGLTIANGIGRRTGMSDQAGTEAWSYDIAPGVGWKTTDRRITNSIAETSIVQSNLAGSMAAFTYPSGRTITYSYSTAGRPISAVDLANSVDWVLNAHYTPFGSLASLQNSNGQPPLITTHLYNARLQPCRISVSSTPPSTCTSTPSNPALDLWYSYGSTNNGNINSIANGNDTYLTQNFTYDSLNRIATAYTNATYATRPGECWAETYGYDAWGNLTTLGVNNTTQSAYVGCPNEIGLATTATSKNQLAFLTYDAAGNVMFDPNVFGGNYTYDAENHLINYVYGSTTATYTYDGDGKRVTSSMGKMFWYGNGSDATTVTDLSGNNPDEYIFFNGARHGWRASNGGARFIHTDHLGTVRDITYGNGVGKWDYYEYYPFGNQVPIAWNPPNDPYNVYKFTGKERDTESGLDNFGARYDSSSLGRFMSPDPENAGAVNSDPQSWNAYTYALNNPINNVDPNGLLTIACISSDPRSTAGLSCVWYLNDADFEKAAANSSGVSAKDGKIYATVDGKQVQVGTYTRDSPTFQDNILAPALFGGLAAGIRSGIRGLVEAMFGGGAKTAVEEAVIPAASNAGAGAAGATAELGGGQILTNQAAGQIIGWGTGQGAAGVQATEQLAQNLTKEAVQEMIQKGLNKATVEGLQNQYARAAADGVKLAANPGQLPARIALMNKILELWPK